MRLVLVRHAESTANAEGRWQGHENFALSEGGRAQAEVLHARFREEGFQPTHVYTSPLRRAAETAEIVARSWDVAIEPWDDLKEHDVGVFSGLTWDEIGARYPDVARDFEAVGERWSSVPGAEQPAARAERARRVIEQTMGRHTGDDVVLAVTHGGILQHYLAALLGADRTWGVPVENTALFDFSLDLGSWSLEGDVRHNTSLWRINCFNDASHLEQV